MVNMLENLQPYKISALSVDVLRNSGRLMLLRLILSTKSPTVSKQFYRHSHPIISQDIINGIRPGSAIYGKTHKTAFTLNSIIIRIL